jgi:1-acyl-sn-glycerol-3-phosphate acyltransferase
VSFVDAVLLMAASPRPIRFVMDHRIFKLPVLGALFKLAKAIPIAPQKEDPAVYEAAFDAPRRCCATATCWHLPRGRHHPRRHACSPSRAAS